MMTNLKMHGPADLNKVVGFDAYSQYAVQINTFANNHGEDGNLHRDQVWG